jgi:hypothetical protein
MEFTKLSDVTLVNEVSKDVNVLIEDNGEIKKVSKSNIGAQADWNETDEGNPAFILNKPTSLGGYAYYAVYSYYITKCEEPVYPENWDKETTTVTAEEFVNDYKSKPIMLMMNGDQVNDYGYGLIPLVNCVYNAYYANKLGLVYFIGYEPVKHEFDFKE